LPAKLTGRVEREGEKHIDPMITHSTTRIILVLQHMYIHKHANN
jgi:hypothetical protein